MALDNIEPRNMSHVAYGGAGLAAAKQAADVTPTQAAVTMVANVSGATANLEFQDSSASLSQAEYRVFAKTIAVELNKIKVDVAAIITALQTAGLMDS